MSIRSIQKHASSHFHNFQLPIYIYICIYIYMCIYIYRFFCFPSILDIFPQNKDYLFKVCSCIQTVTSNHIKLLNTKIYITKRNNTSSYIFEIQSVQQYVSFKKWHSFESAFSAFLHGPFLAGLKFYTYIHKELHREKVLTHAWFYQFALERL